VRHQASTPLLLVLSISCVIDEKFTNRAILTREFAVFPKDYRK